MFQISFLSIYHIQFLGQIFVHNTSFGPYKFLASLSGTDGSLVAVLEIWSLQGHWVAIKNILKYLRRTKDIFLIYGDVDSDLLMKGYTYSIFQYDRDDSKSQSGHEFTLNCFSYLERLQIGDDCRFYNLFRVHRCFQWQLRKWFG